MEFQGILQKIPRHRQSGRIVPKRKIFVVVKKKRGVPTKIVRDHSKEAFGSRFSRASGS